VVGGGRHPQGAAAPGVVAASSRTPRQGIVDGEDRHLPWRYAGRGPAPWSAATEALPTSITVDGRNRLYSTDADKNVVETPNRFRIGRPIAGTGTAGYSGDGGPALTAEFNGPLGLAAVADDALLVADTANQRIRIIQPP
jgi:hypothetical protein